MASLELLEWCRAGGVRWNGVEAGYVQEGYRGVLATADLPPGACVLQVPRRLLMSVESARREPQLQAALQLHGASLSSEQVLTVHLLHEASKGASSFWHPYILSLPRSYTTAMCLNKEEAAALQVPHAVRAARAAGHAAAAQHVAALPVLRALGLAPKWLSRGAWLWAASTLSSRTMYLPFDPAGALTPFGDLHNYRPPPPPYAPTLASLQAAAARLAAVSSGGSSASASSVGSLEAGRQNAAISGGTAGAGTTAAGTAAAAATAAGPEAEESVAGDGHLDEQRDEYCIYTRAPYRAGEQVFLCYGRHTNLELLQHYGFVLPGEGNPHDTALLPPRLLPPAVRQQLAGDGSNGSSGGSGSYGSGEAAGAAGSSSVPTAESGEVLEDAYLHASGAPSWQLLRALRLGCATSAERKAGAFLALSDRPMSAACERAAFRALQEACQGALAALPTTPEADEQQLLLLQGQLRQQADQAAGASAAPAADAAAGAGAEQPPAGGQQQQRQQPAACGQQQQQWQKQQQARGSGTVDGSAQPGVQHPSERLVVTLEWRLAHKRILQRGIALCGHVLETLQGVPQGQQGAGLTAPAAAAAPGCRPAAASPPAADIAARLAALQRKPRW